MSHSPLLTATVQAPSHLHSTLPAHRDQSHETMSAPLKLLIIDGMDDSATTRSLLHQAQQLRTLCFHEQFGVVFENDLDSDRFDAVCRHVILRQGDRVVATTRLLDSERANRLGRFYSEGEFFLEDFLRHYPYPVLEMGRTCVHRKHRSIAALMLLWQGIAQVAQEVKVNAFMGCCSVPLGAGDVNRWLDNHPTHKLNIKPKHRLPPSLLSHEPSPPPLLSLYLRMGASIGQHACFDPAFHCADVFVWLPFEQFPARYQSLLG